jgi:PAT family beta-lactamase induction signal transducer AmpG
MKVDRQLAAMAAYGFVSGLPFSLSGSTFRLWLSDSGAAVTMVGLAAWIGLAYSLKFLWAPLLDQRPPIAAMGRFGRRRGWLLLVQPLLGIAALLFASCDPAGAPWVAFAAATCVAVLSATQDIAIDAWRIETFEPDRQGVALAAYVWGYRAAMLVSTFGVIRSAATIGWNQALLLPATLIVAGTLVTLLARSQGASVGSLPRPTLRHAVIDPIRSFLTRPSAWLVLTFVALFKLGEAMAGIMTAPFYLHLGFDKVGISYTSWFSLGGSLGGYTLGGWLVVRIGVGRALLWTGWAQTAAMAMYVLLSLSPGLHVMLYATVTAEAFAQGLADAAFLTFLSALCAREFAATQYALLSSVPQLAIHTIGGLSGLMAASLGWTLFYVVCMAGAVPGMLLMLALLRRGTAATRASDFIESPAPGRANAGEPTG